MTEHPSFLRQLPPEEKKRLAYIEGREDLFQTKVFEIKNGAEPQAEGEKENILVISRDPGSAGALAPVMELLHHDDTIIMRVLTDGRAEEILEKEFPMNDITPQDMTLGADQVLGTPDVLLVNSSVSEKGLETYAVATYPEVPMILVEDYYTSSLGFLQRLKERKLSYPKKICVLDSEAKNIIVKEFPELEGSIEITGQPAFDRFATEDTEGLKTDARRELSMMPDEKIITFVSASMGTDIKLVEKMADELKKVKAKFRIAFTVHPRDNTPRETYQKIFREAGIACINVGQLGFNKVGAASDVVVMIISTEGLNAIYRRKPTVHITDPRFVVPLKGLTPPPPVTLGASVGLDDVNGLADTVAELLDPESAKNAELRKHMEQNYPVDGKNAQRVADLLMAEMAKN
ncbi:MAG: hypothetical protein WC764_04520 [Candidatus Paceibacterota bacterium]